MDYSKFIKFYPDFPIKGVNFVDIIPFLQNKELFRSLVDDLAAMCDAPNVAAPADSSLPLPCFTHRPTSTTLSPCVKKESFLSPRETLSR